MNKYQERRGYQGELPLSLTHPIPPFALTNQHQVNAERARLKPPFSIFRRVRLIYDHRFSLIESMTCLLFSHLTDTKLTPSRNQPLFRSKKLTYPTPTPGSVCTEVSQKIFVKMKGVKCESTN